MTGPKREIRDMRSGLTMADGVLRRLGFSKGMIVSEIRDACLVDADDVSKSDLTV